MFGIITFLMIYGSALDRMHQDCVDKRLTNCKQYERDEYARSFVWTVSVGFIPFILNILGCVWGKELAEDPYFVSSDFARLNST